jgi:hypothetical protein
MASEFPVCYMIGCTHNLLQKGTTRQMKVSRSSVFRKVFAFPQLRFEDQALTSFSGLLVLHALLNRIQLKQRLHKCVAHLPGTATYRLHTVMLVLIIHLWLGYRQLRDMRYYCDDPLVLRLLGLTRLPDVSTVSRSLASADRSVVENYRRLCGGDVLERLRVLRLRRVTVDFDGSVQSTRRHAEGTAVGYNKKRKGDRSYYPLFCTVAQTGQVLDVLHRSGNVHDSRDALLFILECIEAIRRVLPNVQIEARLDSAFFSDEIITMLDGEGVEFSVSVPFERFAQLKGLIERRQRWWPFSRQWAYFETAWKPKSWPARHRFVFLRQRVAEHRKEPLQLDLFEPREYGYAYTVIVTNKRSWVRSVVSFHHGRGAQEKLFAELKSQCQMDYVPVRTRVGNEIYLWSTVLAHNLARELQMQANPPQRFRSAKRATFWVFQELGTLRRNLIQRAGRLTRPAGRLTLTMSANRAVQAEILHYLTALGVEQPATI